MPNPRVNIYCVFPYAHYVVDRGSELIKQSLQYQNVFYKDV